MLGILNEPVSFFNEAGSVLQGVSLPIKYF